MSSSIFGNPIENAVSAVRNISQGNVGALFKQMMASNPEFRAFVNANRNKSPEQIAAENGIDINQIRQLM